MNIWSKLQTVCRLYSIPRTPRTQRKHRKVSLHFYKRVFLLFVENPQITLVCGGCFFYLFICREWRLCSHTVVTKRLLRFPPAIFPTIKQATVCQCLDVRYLTTPLCNGLTNFDGTWNWYSSPILFKKNTEIGSCYVQCRLNLKNTFLNVCLI